MFGNAQMFEDSTIFHPENRRTGAAFQQGLRVVQGFEMLVFVSEGREVLPQDSFDIGKFIQTYGRRGLGVLGGGASALCLIFFFSPS